MPWRQSASGQSRVSGNCGTGIAERSCFVFHAKLTGYGTRGGGGERPLPEAPRRVKTAHLASVPCCAGSKRRLRPWLAFLPWPQLRPMPAVALVLCLCLGLGVCLFLGLRQGRRASSTRATLVSCGSSFGRVNCSSFGPNGTSCASPVDRIHPLRSV
jgi:hypothetical protein